MSSGSTRRLRGHAYKEAFLASLAHFIAAPSADWPTVRCWTKSSLNRMFRDVKDEVGEAKPPQSNLELLGWLEKLGLAWAIQAEGSLFYLLELGASARSEIAPQELMMAYEPKGVVCFLSAMVIHSLTSQIPSHHHVAVLTNPRPAGAGRAVRSEGNGGEAGAPPTAAGTDGGQRVGSKSSPLGKVVFSYLGIHYHLTRRAARLAPGVQIRGNGPRCRVRITTYEQTLLDTLYKPYHCGGPPVVFEAWKEGAASGRLDEEKLVSYMKRMDYPATARRLAVMLRLMDYAPGRELANYLDRVQQGIDRTAQYSRISLLPGLDYSNLDEEWLVNAP